MNGNINKNFLCNLIKMHDPNAQDCDADNLKVDSWESSIEMETMWECDTNPNSKGMIDAPTYSNNFTSVLQEDGQKVKTDSRNAGSRNSCFNCLGDHLIMECPKPRDPRAITKNRREFMNKSSGFFRQNTRYHLGEEQIYSHMVPGLISTDLRRALGLEKNQLPRHVYRMRLFGYPSGWLEDARVERSGIALYVDAKGNEMLNPDDEEGEIVVPGSKDAYDISKIHEFPGFNVPADPKMLDESRFHRCPPMLREQSKEEMVKLLQHRSATSYKKRSTVLVPIMSLPDDGKKEEGSNSEEDISKEKCASISPSLEDLEAKKQSLVAELESKLIETNPQSTPGEAENLSESLQLDGGDNQELDCKAPEGDPLLTPQDTKMTQHIDLGTPINRGSPYSRTPSTPCTKIGTVKQIEQGTPILKSASPFSLLPSPDKFSKGICDVINFENLPDSLGHYNRMNQVIKDVRVNLKNHQ